MSGFPAVPDAPWTPSSMALFHPRHPRKSPGFSQVPVAASGGGSWCPRRGEARRSRRAAAGTSAAVASAILGCLLASATAAAAPRIDIGFDGIYRTGSWTPLAVATREDGTVAARVWVEDADGELVGSTPAANARSPNEDPVPTRFLVRFGRPDARVVVEWGDGSREPILPPAALESTSRVLVVIGDLPCAERAARLMQRGDGTRIRVVPLTAAAVFAPSGRSFDGADAVVICGSAVATMPPATLAALDAWVVRGGKLVFLAGLSAAPPALEEGPASAWIPGPPGSGGRVARMVPLRRTAAIETYAKAGRPLDRAAVAALEAPLLEDPASLDGTIEAWDGSSPVDLPLVVRRARGFGTVTWAGIDLDRGSFRSWQGSDSLLVELLGGRAAKEGRAGEGGSRSLDLGGQLRVAVDRFSGVAAVPFEVVAGMALLYVACLYPLEWWVVSRSGRPRIAWLTLPLLVAAFTGLSWWTAARYKVGERRTNRADVIDVDVAGSVTRGTSFLGVWSPANAAISVSAGPLATPPIAGPAIDAAVSWYAVRGRGMGAVDAPTAHPSLATAPSFAPQPDRLEQVPLAAASSRVFEGEWIAPCGPAVVDSDLRRDAQGMLRGRLVSRLPFALEGCAVYHAGWCYDIGSFAPGASFDPLAGKGPRTLAAALTRSAAVMERVQTERWDTERTDLERILEIVGFHEAAGGTSYTSLEAGPLGRLDLSALLPIERAVLVGRGPAGTAWRLDGDARDAAAAVVLWRIVIPLDRRPAERAPPRPNPSTATSGAFPPRDTPDP